MRTTLIATVGHLGKNLPRDVQTVQALLNVHHRQKKVAPLPVHGRYDEDTQAALETFQMGLMKVCPKFWPLVKHRCPTHRALQQIRDKALLLTSPLAPEEGRLTWDAEGQEGGPFHSRTLHVPSMFSGLTIGRGYDCSMKSSMEIYTDLLDAGLSNTHAKSLSEASGLKGASAEAFIIERDLLDFQITAEQQLQLFKKTYANTLQTTIEVIRRDKRSQLYKAIDWKKLDSTMLDVLVDLTYRGDNLPSTREFLIESVSKNDVDAFCALIRDAGKWSKVPPERFRLRSNYCSNSGTQS